MITIFNRKEVYVGYSMGECGRVRDILSDHKIKYDYNCISSNNSFGFASDRATMGSFGENPDFAYLYYVYVHKNNYEQACYLINQR